MRQAGYYWIRLNLSMFSASWEDDAEPQIARFVPGDTYPEWYVTSSEIPFADGDYVVVCSQRLEKP